MTELTKPSLTEEEKDAIEKAYWTNWRNKNRERLNAYRREYYKNNKDKIKQYQMTYYERQIQKQKALEAEGGN